MESQSTQVQTIIGGNGTIGSEVAKQLNLMGIPVRIASRSPVKVNPGDELAYLDVFNPVSIVKAVQGSETVYLILGLEYKDKVWQEGFPRAVQNVLEACRIEGAKFVYFDNVYMYGKVIGKMHEGLPSKPVTIKGKARMLAANLVLEAIQKNNIQAMICRSADFYGNYPAYDAIKNIAEALIQNKKPILLLRDDKKHSMTFIPDAGKAVAILAQKSDAYQQIWHVPTDPNALTGKELVELIADLLKVKPTYKILPKWILRIASIFNKQLREVLKLSYQYEQDYLFSSEKGREKYGLTGHTYREGILEHLTSIGLLKAQEGNFVK